MSAEVFRYGLFGVGRCGCVHGEILLAQGQQLVALGDENPSALAQAVHRLSLSGAATFSEASSMAQRAKIDAVVIASHTKDHARDAEPFVRAGIPVYLEKPPQGTIGRLDLSRTHASGYLNETEIIGTTGTLHVGRFCGYPGPILVELWTGQGKLHPKSQIFQMRELAGQFAEFQPRFQQAYETAHTQFRLAVRTKQQFSVTPIDVLNAQVMVEAAHRSALNGGVEFAIARSENLDEYEQLCRQHQLFDP